MGMDQAGTCIQTLPEDTITRNHFASFSDEAETVKKTNRKWRLTQPIVRKKWYGANRDNNKLKQLLSVYFPYVTHRTRAAPTEWKRWRPESKHQIAKRTKQIYIDIYTHIYHHQQHVKKIYYIYIYMKTKSAGGNTISWKLTRDSRVKFTLSRCQSSATSKSTTESRKEKYVL